MSVASVAKLGHSANCTQAPLRTTVAMDIPAESSKIVFVPLPCLNMTSGVFLIEPENITRPLDKIWCYVTRSIAGPSDVNGQLCVPVCITNLSPKKQIWRTPS